jgi:hypothetical protein
MVNNKELLNPQGLFGGGAQNKSGKVAVKSETALPCAG